MQYLIHCKDTSYCLLYQKEIIYDPDYPDIKIGAVVSFHWDGNANVVFSGTVIAASGRKFMVSFFSATQEKIFT